MYKIDELVGSCFEYSVRSQNKMLSQCYASLQVAVYYGVNKAHREGGKGGTNDPGRQP